ncbi:hypothetical protein EDB84DRAFT_1437757 [Lactarius hengduanensis]|nr:hypothetical protein EDB84DRAFT_1437757 [Lactarius hengduanensis]
MSQSPHSRFHAPGSRNYSSDSSSNIESIFDAALKSLKKWLVPTINVLYAFSGTLGEGVALVNIDSSVFPPAKLVFAGVGVLLLPRHLVDIFGRIESFFMRLEIYTEVPLTPAMTDKMVEITVEILDILATATKEMGQSQAKKFFKKVAGRKDLEDGMKKLDKLTNEEVAMASVQNLKVTHTVDNKVTAVGDGVKGVDERVQVVNDNVKAVDDKVQTIAEGGQCLFGKSPASSPIFIF